MRTSLNISDTESRFEWIARSRVAPSGDRWDVPLVETDNFVAIPSLGSIVPGWVLIVPRLSVRNLASLSVVLRAEMRHVRDNVAAVLAHRFDGELFEFEHGAGAPNSLLGCGVEHAHLHLVPLGFDLLATVLSADVGGAGSTFGDDPWAGVEADSDYWIARRLSDGTGVIAHPSKPVSQGIRKLIAERTGQARAWNYRDYPHIDNIDATLRAFQVAMT